MSDQNFTTTFLVDQTPQEAFAAVSNPRDWWSDDINGPTDQLGGVFKYRAGDLHRCTMKIVELVPNERVVWECLDNYFEFTNDKTEWIGTNIVFEVSEEGGQTRVRFTHEGLVPNYECFNICTNAWGGYISGSLKSLITTGTGNPNNDVRNAEALSHR